MPKLKHERVPPSDIAALLRYDPETGLLTWRTRHSIRIKRPGAMAGTIDRLGYVLISVNYRRLRGHTIAWVLMTGDYPKGEIDHINGVKSDNRWSNLREVNRSGNMRNLQRARKDSRYGVPGVSSHTAGRTFTAEIRIGGIRKYLGSFSTREEAGAAYQAAKRSRDADLIRGGVRGQTSTGKRTNTRAVASVTENVRLNRALWTLTERMAELAQQ